MRKNSQQLGLKPKSKLKVIIPVVLGTPRKMEPEEVKKVPEVVLEEVKEVPEVVLEEVKEVPEVVLEEVKEVLEEVKIPEVVLEEVKIPEVIPFLAKSSKYKLNHKPSPPDHRDHTVKVIKIPKIERYDLSQFCTSIKNQGNIGSCTSFAGVGLMEYFYKKNLGGKIDDVFSEKFLYYTTRVNIEQNLPSEDSGTFLRDTLKSMVQFGVCLEKTFPYIKPGQSTCDYTEKPEQNAYDEALNYQVTKYARIPETDKNQCLQDLKTLLLNGSIFMGGFVCYENMYDGKDGNIPLPKGNITGGHAVLFVGYDDTKQLFKFKNSWGSLWGDKGYGYLPYQFVLTGNLSDMWTVYQEEFENKTFDIVVPGK